MSYFLFWTCLARESRQKFKRCGTDGKRIEAREPIIALPENFTQYDPDEILKEFTEKIKGQYGVESTSALRYNKTESIVKRYEWELAEWKQQVEGKPTEEKKPPERRSVVAEFQRIRGEAQKPPKRSYRDRGER